MPLIRTFSIAVLALAVLLPAQAGARQTEPQRFFREKLLDDDQVSKPVKDALRGGGFVDPSVDFADLTGDDRQDALVTVHSGGSAGRIGLYVFTAPDRGDELRLAYRNQRLYRALGRLRRNSIVYTVPLYRAGDELCCPSAARQTELRYDMRRERFRVTSRRTVETT